ncbi:kielin/chordin-like protein isoform X2 [Ptychodera flava]|uniref:kielin/chordin-like protein isoform X2 n=1 Tax=Ptychodera flava TaxID=63121 RepID=UPI003969DAFD
MYGAAVQRKMRKMTKAGFYTGVFVAIALEWATPSVCQCPSIENVFEPAKCELPCDSDQDCPDSLICCKVSPTSECRHQCFRPQAEAVFCVDSETQQLLEVGTEWDNSNGMCCSCLSTGLVDCRHGPCSTTSPGEAKPGECLSSFENQLCGELGCHGDRDCPLNQKCCDAIPDCHHTRTCTTPSQTALGCTENIRQYQEGEVVRILDSCNNCTCLQGEIVCSQNICSDTCIYNERLFHPGDIRRKENRHRCSICTGGKVNCHQHGK